MFGWIRKGWDYPEGPVLGLEIDDDFAAMSRYELCCHIEDKFELERDSFEVRVNSEDSLLLSNC